MITICLPNLLRFYLIFLAIEEHGSEVLQVECSMESPQPSEQEQSHSEGTDILVVVYGRWYFTMKVNNIHENNFLSLIGLEQCSF